MTKSRENMSARFAATKKPKVSTMFEVLEQIATNDPNESQEKCGYKGQDWSPTLFQDFAN